MNNEKHILSKCHIQNISLYATVYIATKVTVVLSYKITTTELKTYAEGASIVFTDIRHVHFVSK